MSKLFAVFELCIKIEKKIKFIEYDMCTDFFLKIVTLKFMLYL